MRQYYPITVLYYQNQAYRIQVYSNSVYFYNVSSPTHISATFIQEHTHYPALIGALKKGFSASNVKVPQRQHIDFENPNESEKATLLMMPAWQPDVTAGVKLVTVHPKNGSRNLPAIQGIYIYIDSKTGQLIALLDAPALTAARTAAASALASQFLSNKDAHTLLMLGTGALSIPLIKAHCSVRPISKVYVWGRTFSKAEAIANALKNQLFDVIPINNYTSIIEKASIISCATLSSTPLLNGKLLKEGQHIDLVGAYTTNMREADDNCIQKASIFVDTHFGINESGDISIPLQNGILTKKDIKADLFDLCKEIKQGRSSNKEITLFKSVGYALEDLIAAEYYYKQFQSQLK